MGLFSGWIDRTHIFQFTVLKFFTKSRIESKLIQVESQASILIPDKNVNTVNSKIWVLSIHARNGPVHPIGRRRAARRRDYKSEWRSFGCTRGLAAGAKARVRLIIARHTSTRPRRHNLEGRYFFRNPT